MTSRPPLKYFYKDEKGISVHIVSKDGERLQKRFAFAKLGGPAACLQLAYREAAAFTSKHGRTPLPPISEYAAQFDILQDDVPRKEDVPDRENADPSDHTNTRNRTANIRWTDQEREMVAKEFARLRLTHFQESVIELACIAQQNVLPPDRQRPIKTFAMLGDGMIALIRAASLALVEKLNAPPAPEPPPPAAEAPPPPVPEVITIEVENRDPARVIRAMSPGELLGAAIDRFCDDLKRNSSQGQAVTQSLLSALGKQAAYVPPAPPPIVVDATPMESRRARVLVVGLLNGQVQEVQNKTEKLNVQVSYYDADAVGRDIPASVEFVVLNKFISHRWWEKAKNALPPDRMFFVQGTTGVIQKLFDISSRQPASAGA